MDKYIPRPLDTSDVQLPDELKPLVEAMARNVHEVWAANRIADGWKYGPVRDDAATTTPCLVPYDKLPERERDYDRDTALETLRFILKSGFRIIPPIND